MNEAQSIQPLRYPLRIGVTGHRDLEHPEEVEQAAEQTRRAIEATLASAAKFPTSAIDRDGETVIESSTTDATLARFSEALHTITTATGSLVLALALTEGHIDSQTAWMLSRVDEMFQAEHWGMDEEARDKTEALRLTLSASARFLRMCDHGRVAVKVEST